MHAAVVSSPAQPPSYEHVPSPEPVDEDAFAVDVLAAGLHPRVRSGASGAHYSSDGGLPLIPGVDGVGRRADGTLVYFVALDDRLGTMAERAVTDARHSVPLPGGADPVAIAAGMNPAMSAWLALRKRVDLAPGRSVLVLGATGNAGGMAVEIARHLGAGRIVVAGRNAERLAALPADATLPLSESSDWAAAADVDVVLDYLWGPPAHRALVAIATARDPRSRPLDWIQIAAVAGPELALPSAVLRAANVRIMGSGQGSIDTSEIVAELPAIADLITSGVVSVDPVPMPLEDIGTAWDASVGPGQRVVITPAQV